MEQKPLSAGIYILQKIRNYVNLKIQNGKTLPITMYDFIHIIHERNKSYIKYPDHATFQKWETDCKVSTITLSEAPEIFQQLVWILRNIFSVWQSFSSHLIGKVCCTVWQKLCQDSEKIRNNAIPCTLA